MVRKGKDGCKMAVSVARVKPLKGVQASKFLTALKTSKVRSEAVEKSKSVNKKSFNSK